MRITDAQVHAWANGESTGHHRRAPITGEVLEAEMERAGVDRVVIVPPLWDRGGNAYALALAQQHPERFAVMGLLDLDAGDPAEQLRSWRDRGMRGVRFLLNTPERQAPLLAGTLEPIWPLAQELGLVVALLVPGALHVVDDIARRHAKLSIIVDHLGVPRGATGPAAFDHLPALVALARHPSVHVKAVAVGDYALDPYPFRSVDDVLHRVVDAFGPSRVIWGSDLSRIHHSYRQCVTHFTESLTWLSTDDLALVMDGNISRLLEWE